MAKKILLTDFSDNGQHFNGDCETIARDLFNGSFEYRCIWTSKDWPEGQPDGLFRLFDNYLEVATDNYEVVDVNDWRKMLGVAKIFLDEVDRCGFHWISSGLAIHTGDNLMTGRDEEDEQDYSGSDYWLVDCGGPSQPYDLEDVAEFFQKYMFRAVR